MRIEEAEILPSVDKLVLIDVDVISGFFDVLILQEDGHLREPMRDSASEHSHSNSQWCESGNSFESGRDDEEDRKRVKAQAHCEI